MLDKKDLEIEMNNAIKWIKDYVLKSGAKGVVVGNSGGKDSATVIAMATKALGKDNVLTVAMPCMSSISDLEDAKLVAETFETRMLDVDLTDTFNEIENSIENEIKKINFSSLSKEAKINIKPRLRMMALYGIAQTLNYLVIGTGNLCEAMVRIYY